MHYFPVAKLRWIFCNKRIQSTTLDPRTCLGLFWSISLLQGKGYKTGAFRHPNALFSSSEVRVDFFATNASNHPNYTLEHVWECFRAFGYGTKNDAKRVHFGTRMHYFRVAKLGWIFSQRTHPIFLIIP